MTILHPTTSTSHTRAVRAAWIAIAASPFVLGAAVVVALLLGGGTGGLWIGGTLLALAAMAAPTVALVESRAADRRAEHGAGPALAASAADWLLVVAALALAVVSPIAVLIALTVSACVVLVVWGTGAERGDRQ